MRNEILIGQVPLFDNKQFKEKSLLLTLNPEAFAVMVTGEKKSEYRIPSKWILSRLKNKNGEIKRYDTVIFQNGYSSSSPYFIAKFKGYIISKRVFSKVYSNGLVVDIEIGDIIIHIGNIIETGNLKKKQK